MSMTICASCLFRLRSSSKLNVPISAISLPTFNFFHTTAPQANVVKKKSSGVVHPKKFRGSTSAIIRKKHRERPKPPPVGERKALRKRLVLSNTNALGIEDMTDLSAENMATEEYVGQILGLEGALLDQLREAKAFKTTQNWNIFRRPATLIRKETLSLGRNVAEVNQSLNDDVMGPLTLRQIITGERSTGKSVLLLQAMSMAYLNDWVVINVPEAQDFTIGHSSYGPLPQSTGSHQDRQYIQPGMTTDLLSRAAFSNEKLLSSLKVSHPHKIPGVKTDKLSLYDLALIPRRDPSIAWPVWQAFWKELNEPSSAKDPRPPVLIAIDGLDHWMGLSQYRSAEHELIHARQLSLIRQFASLLFTPSNLTNGGMILAATSASNSPAVPAFKLLLRQMAARAAGVDLTSQEFPMPEPYGKVDQRVLDLLGGSEATSVQTLTGVSRAEARSLLEYFARSGILKESITDVLVSEKWALSGGGVIGEIAKFAKRVRV